MKTSRVKKTLIAESHKRQFNGEDYQAVAIDLSDRIENCTDEEHKELCSSPDPDCKCSFCASAPWED